MKLTRRGFLKCGGFVATGSVLPWPLVAAEGSGAGRPYRAVVIGRTGGGDYGHGYDQIFNGVQGVTVQAVADADSAGLAKAKERSGAERSYADYREMLEKEKPDLVCIAPRQPDCHKEMCLAAIEVCRGIFIEKPFTETIEDADGILEAADKKGVKIQVAHNRRYAEVFVRAGALIREGLIGEVRTVQIRGKQDSRAGGEDLIVLGTHDFDLMRAWFGDPQWCFAQVTVDGRDVERSDFRSGHEPIKVAGDTVRAQFSFPKGLVVFWESVKRGDHWNTNFSKREKWSFEVLGTKGIVAYQSGLEFAWLNSPFLAQREDAERWQPLPQPREGEWPEWERHPIKSLMHAIKTGGDPICSGKDGRWAIEMVAAVYQSHLSRSRVSLPLLRRGA